MYKKEGFPEESDLLICTVKDISQYSAKFDLDEFRDLEGTVNSSEMNRRWARNIRVFIKPGRKIVCKVLGVDKHTNHINLSIKRVGVSQAKTKQDNWSREKRANDLLITLSKSLKIKYETLFEKIGKPVLREYDLIYPFLRQIIIDESIVDELKLDKKLESAFVQIVRKRIKLKKANIRCILRLHSKSPDGLAVIKKSLQMLESLVKEKGDEIEIKYLGAPNYQIIFKSLDLKHGEDNLIGMVHKVEKYVKKNQGDLKLQKAVS